MLSGLVSLGDCQDFRSGQGSLRGRGEREAIAGELAGGR